MEAVQQNRVTPYLVIQGQNIIPTWTTPIAALFIAALVMPGSSLLGHLCGMVVGYLCTFPLHLFDLPIRAEADYDRITVGLGYLARLVPPDGVCRWIETKLRLRSFVPFYVSVDQKTYGRSGVLPSSSQGVPLATLGVAPVISPAVGAPGLVGSNQRLGTSPE